MASVSITKKSGLDGYFIVSFTNGVFNYVDLVNSAFTDSDVIIIELDNTITNQSNNDLINHAIQAYNAVIGPTTPITELNTTIINNHIFVVKYEDNTTPGTIIDFKILLFKNQTVDFSLYNNDIATKSNSILNINITTIPGIRGLFYVVNPDNTNILHIEDEIDYPHIKNLTMGDEDSVGINYLKERNITTFIPFDKESDDTCGYFLSNNTENIKLTNCDNYYAIGSTPSNTTNGINGSGGFIGSNCSNIILENCHNYGNIINNDCGGLIGKDGSVSGACIVNNCANDGYIIGTNAGGVCGSNVKETGLLLAIKCRNNGFIFGNNCGGIIGFNPISEFINNIPTNDERINKISFINSTYGVFIEKTVNVVDCKNNNSIYGIASGGIVGALDEGSVYIANCVNDGIIGKMTIPSVIINYLTSLSITVTNRVPEPFIGFDAIKLKCGGILGSFSTKDTTNRGASIIDNCVNNGIIGENYSRTQNIVNDCGGIVGHFFGYKRDETAISIIKNCKNYGIINAEISGGISGGREAFDGNCILQNCTNYGDIKGSGSGGIGGGYAGFGGKIEIKSCINYGTILENPDSDAQIGQGYSGGIVGSNCCYFEGKLGTCIISMSYNYGEILNDYSGGITGSNACDLVNNTVSGIPDKKNKGCMIQNCINNGIIKSDYSGGICGAYAGSSNGLCNIKKCINNADIEGVSSGGICGLNVGYLSNNLFEDPNTEFVVIEKCVNNGELKGDSCGGICGSNTSYNGRLYDDSKNIYGCIIKECKNTGIINANHCGGIVGSFNTSILDTQFKTNSNVNKINGTLLISKCVNDGEIIKQFNGGMIGMNSLGFLNYSTITKCINNGDILSNNCGGIVAGGSETYINLYTEIDANNLKDREVSITKCVNNGKVGNVDSAVIEGCGGIVAPLFSLGYSIFVDNNIADTNNIPTIKECINRGNFINAKNCSGIVGINNDSISIGECVNYGNMFSKEPDGMLCGIGGGIDETSEKLFISVTTCINIGNLNGVSCFGIYGNLSPLNNGTDLTTLLEFGIDSCINYGSLNNNITEATPSPISSGIMGSINAPNLPTETTVFIFINECYNMGIVGNSGILYKYNTAVNLLISECYNLGRVLDETIDNEIFNINAGFLSIINSYHTKNEVVLTTPSAGTIKNINDLKNTIPNTNNASSVYSIGFPYPMLKPFQNPQIWTNYNNFDDVPILVNIPLEYQEFNIRRVQYEGEHGVIDPITTEILNSSTLVNETIDAIKTQLGQTPISEVGTFTLSSDPAQNNLLSGIIVEFLNKVNNP